MALIYTWRRTGTGGWNDAANWSPAGGPPGTADTAVFDFVLTPSVVLTGTATVGLIQVDFGTVAIAGGAAASTVLVKGTLDVMPGASLGVAGDLALRDGTLRADGAGVNVGATLHVGRHEPPPGDGQDHGGVLQILNGGTVHAGHLDLQDYRYLGTERLSTIVVDASSVLEIGTAGTGAAGTLTIDSDGTLSGNSFGPIQAAAILNDGTIDGTLTLNRLVNRGLVIGGYVESGENHGTIRDAFIRDLVNQGTIIGGHVSQIGGAGTILVGRRLALGAEVENSIVFDGPGELAPDVGLGGTFLVSGFAPGSVISFAVGAVDTVGSIHTGDNTTDLVIGFQTPGATTFRLAGNYDGAIFYPFVGDFAEFPRSSVVMFSGNPGAGTMPASAGTGTADHFRWTSHVGGDWGAAENWQALSSGDNPAGSAPGIHNHVTVETSGQLIHGSGNAASLFVPDNLALSGLFQVGTLRVGAPGSGTGILGLLSGTHLGAQVAHVRAVQNDGGTLMVTGDLTLGHEEAGAATVTPAGILSVRDTGAVIAGGLSLAPGSVIRLDDTGAVVVGTGAAAAGTLTVAGDGTILGGGTLSAATIANAGTISGAIELDSGLIANAGLISVAESGGLVRNVVNSGMLIAAAVDNVRGPGTIVAGRLENIGTDAVIQISGGALVEFGANVRGTVQFLPGPGLLTMDGGGTPATVEGFGTDDEIVLRGVQGTTATYVQQSASAGRLIISSGTAEIATLLLNGDFTGHTFYATVPAFDDASTYVTLDGPPTTPACFAAGTLIRTLQGEIPVEALRPGDRVAVMSDARLRTVRWVGHRRVDASHYSKPEEIWPVRIEAGALADGVPRRAVRLSPDHAIYAEGVLIPAKALVNGRSIRQVRANLIDYWHVELSQHDILFADGLPAETYLDTGNRSAFANGSGMTALHPNLNALTWDAQACAPLVITGVAVDRVRAAIAYRLEAPGQADHELRTETLLPG